MIKGQKFCKNDKDKFLEEVLNLSVFAKTDA